MSFDLTKVDKNINSISIKKEGTNKRGFLYFSTILFFLSLIVFFSSPNSRLIVSIVSFFIACSSLVFIFHKYRVVFDFEKRLLLIEKVFIFRKRWLLSLDDIIDYRLKEGEAGFLVLAVKGQNIGFFLKPEKKYTIFRSYKESEAEDLLKTIKEYVSRETKN